MEHLKITEKLNIREDHSNLKDDILLESIVPFSVILNHFAKGAFSTLCQPEKKSRYMSRKCAALRGDNAQANPNQTQQRSYLQQAIGVPIVHVLYDCDS